MIRQYKTHTEDYVEFGADLGPEKLFTMLHCYPNLNCLLLHEASSQDFGTSSGVDSAQQYKGNTSPEWISIAGSGTVDISHIAATKFTENLIYLDASASRRGPNWTRALTIRNFPSLRILKLRSLRLTDELLPSLITNSRCQLWSLDLRDNLLTDRTIVELLQKETFLGNIPGFARSRNLEFQGNSVFFSGLDMHTSDEMYFANPPHYDEEASDGVVAFRPDIVGEIRHSSSGRNQVPILERRRGEQDDLLEFTGITHLWLSKNKLTAKGVWYLLSSTNRLQLLDVGSVRTTLVPIGTGVGAPDIFAQEFTTDALRLDACPRLEELRIHHSIITQFPSVISRSNSYNIHEISSNARITQACHSAMKQQNGHMLAPFDANQNTKLRVLTLTSIPRRGTPALFQALRFFIVRLAAQETNVAEIRYSIGAHRRSPELLTGLRKLRLEFLPEDSAARARASSSVTGDRDAEVYYERMRLDFAGLNFNELRAPTPEQREAVGTVPTVDIIEELKAWREIEVRRWLGNLEIIKLAR